MKILKITTTGFKKCKDDFTLDFVTRSKKTVEDKEYELLEIADGLYTFNTVAFVGPNASGKTTVLELILLCESILSSYHVNKSGNSYSYDAIHLEIFFFHEGYVFLYKTDLVDKHRMSGYISFKNESLYRRRYSKSILKSLFSEKDMEMIRINELPDDTSAVYFALKDARCEILFFSSRDALQPVYNTTFEMINDLGYEGDLIGDIIRIFDKSITGLRRLDSNTYELLYSGRSVVYTDEQLMRILSSGTNKGLLLYTYMIVSLCRGTDLIVDEIDNHFHNTLVDNMISLYKDRRANRRQATLFFTTHNARFLDDLNRQDSIWITKGGDQISISNMYEFGVRHELSKSRRYYDNTYGTAIDYDNLMRLKKDITV